MAKIQRLVLIEWHDATSTDGWMDEKKVEEEATTLCQSVGWLVKNNKKHTTLVSHKGVDPADGDYGAIWTIPTSCIERIVDLVEKNEHEGNPVSGQTSV